jgi:hypothetical protein
VARVLSAGKDPATRTERIYMSAHILWGLNDTTTLKHLNLLAYIVKA